MLFEILLLPIMSLRFLHRRYATTGRLLICLPFLGLTGDFPVFVDYSTEWRECSIAGDDERYSL